jgi:hypothetical protein
VNFDAANFAWLFLHDHVLVLLVDVKIHSIFLRESLSGTVRALVNLFAGMNTKMTVEGNL